MKKALLTALCLLTILPLFAQEDIDERKPPKTAPLARLEQADRILVDIFTDIWMNTPGDSVMSLQAIQRGANINVLRDFPLGESNFSFAVGLGVSCHNLYSNAWPVRESVQDTNSALGYVFTGKTVFQKLPDSAQTFSGSMMDVDYKNNKLALVYIDLPLEFRFRTKNQGQKFKVALGFKVGYLLSSHTKYRGDDVSLNYINNSWGLVSEETVKTKTYKVPNLESYRMGPTLRIGWGWVNVSAYYSLTKLFKKGKGYEMYPISVGLTITPPI
jgi:hypothetical protein